MRKTIFILSLLAHCALAQDAEFVIVRPEGISPAGAVATIDQLASNAVAVVAAEAALIATSNAVEEVALLVDGVAQVVNSLEGIGYIRGYMLDFGVAGIEASTNVTATIIRYDHDVARVPGYIYSDVYTYFSEEPGDWPTVRWTEAARGEANWMPLESVEVELTNITVGATNYECYRNRVKIPEEWAGAFFRIFADAKQMQVGEFLPVRKGISVGGMEPLTAEFTVGGQTIKFVGGVRVVPDEP